MSFNKLFSYASADMPNRSTHDLSHKNLFTAPCGTLVPSFMDFLIPGDIVDLSTKMHVQLPPMATDFYGRINLRTELFYVPARTIFGGWKQLITYPEDGVQGPAPDDPNYHTKYFPGAEVSHYSSKFSLLIPQPTGNVMYSNLSANPTRYKYSSNSFSDINALQEAAIVCVNNTLQQLNNVISAYDSQFTGIADYAGNVGAGSLSDYLGFKVGDFQGYKEAYTKDFLIEAESYFNDNYQSLVDSIPDTGSRSYTISYTQGDATLYLLIKKEGATGANAFFSAVYGFEDSYFSEPTVINNILPFVAYHKIYDDWYRDARIQKPLFPTGIYNSGTASSNHLATVPYITHLSTGFAKKIYKGEQLKFYDGKSLLDLRQRLWQKDYFTTMTAQPQAGDPAKVEMQIDENGATSFTIAALREANALQQWAERNNLVDPRYGDIHYAQYGEYPDDAITDRSIYLGSSTTEIYNKSVFQQAQYDGNSANPFNAIGSKYASPVGVSDNSSLCNNYHVKEHGFLIALTSLVPQAYYSTGVRRMFNYNTIADIAFPLLQGVGDQEVYAREIVNTYGGTGDDTVIGYQSRYAEYKFIEDQVHGLLRDGETLEAFALQRSFTEAPELGTEFLEIPREYLDQVAATDYKVSDYGCWIDSYWSYRKSSRLSELNAIPTLGRMRDVHNIQVVKAGRRL